MWVADQASETTLTTHFKDPNDAEADVVEHVDKRRLAWVLSMGIVALGAVVGIVLALRGGGSSQQSVMSEYDACVQSHYQADYAAIAQNSGPGAGTTGLARADAAAECSLERTGTVEIHPDPALGNYASGSPSVADDSLAPTRTSQPAQPYPTSEPTTEAPSPSVSGPQAVLANVIASAEIWAGPSDAQSSDGSAIYLPTNRVLQANEQVQPVCAIYGRASTVSTGSPSRLWIYVKGGYVSATAFSETDTQQIKACVGTLQQPTAGPSLPDPALGPFPTFAGHGPLHVADSPGGLTGVALPVGALVHLVCYASGPTYPGPTDILGGSTGSSTSWDKIDGPISGWLPDEIVYSQSDNSTAPACG